MNLTEFRMRAMNDEVQMIEDLNFFEQKVASFKKDLYLSPYAKINEILAWCELLIKYEKQIDLLCLEAKQAIQDKLNKLNPTTIEKQMDIVSEVEPTMFIPIADAKSVIELAAKTLGMDLSEIQASLSVKATDFLDSELPLQLVILS